jgi:hypothetical protein
MIPPLAKPVPFAVSLQSRTGRPVIVKMICLALLSEDALNRFPEHSVRSKARHSIVGDNFVVIDHKWSNYRYRSNTASAVLSGKGRTRKFSTPDFYELFKDWRSMTGGYADCDEMQWILQRDRPYLPEDAFVLIELLIS